MSGEDERPICPAGQTLLRAFNGENVATAGRSYAYEYGISGEEEDDDDLEMTRQDFENAVLGVTHEVGVDDGLQADLSNDEGLNEMDANELIERSLASRGSGGLSADVIAMIPCAPFGSNEGKECPVCISELQAEQITMCLPCGHLFHKECILRWFQKEGRCPCCRLEVTSEGLSGEDHFGITGTVSSRARLATDAPGGG